ncbi:MAG TPA: hypothetical protein VFR57_05630 [Burkholderiales bacterium]|nr:hypothetical protein [Burkholderiales bacterium]
MKRRLLVTAIAAAGLAGCGTEPVTHINYHEMDPSKGMFAESATWEWRRKEPSATSAATPKPAAAPAAAAAAPAAAAPSAAEQEEFKKWRESAGASERQEFEEWRAWQEWKRKNPK